MPQHRTLRGTPTAGRSRALGIVPAALVAGLVVASTGGPSLGQVPPEGLAVQASSSATAVTALGVAPGQDDARPISAPGPVLVAEPSPLASPDASALTGLPGAAPGGAAVAAAPLPAGSAAGVPVRVLVAYRAAAERLGRDAPGCGLPWWVLAGIGKVESGHASGGRVDDTGRTRGTILGPRLDGSLDGTARITDSDGGAVDGDAAFDRAVGPMQFLPGTWAGFGADADGDGRADPHDVDDAALGAGRYLCSGARDGALATEAGQRAALMRYNRSVAYGLKVLGFGAAYRDGVAAVPGAAGAVPAGAVPSPLPVPPPASLTAPDAAPVVPVPQTPPPPAEAPAPSPEVIAPAPAAPAPQVPSVEVASPEAPTPSAPVPPEPAPSAPSPTAPAPVAPSPTEPAPSPTAPAEPSPACPVLGAEVPVDPSASPAAPAAPPAPVASPAAPSTAPTEGEETDSAAPAPACPDPAAPAPTAPAPTEPAPSEPVPAATGVPTARGGE